MEKLRKLMRRERRVQRAKRVCSIDSLGGVMVICTFVSTECPKECPHSTNHEPIQDIYDFDKDGYPVTGYCHIVGGECGYRSLEHDLHLTQRSAAGRKSYE